MKNSGSQHPERRKYPRFTYKVNQRPILRAYNRKYHVINISKGGITIQSRPDSLPLTTSRLEGSIMFLEGEISKITGDIAWIIGDKMGVKFNNPLPDATISREQSRIEKA
jgi:hypothetical protein